MNKLNKAPTLAHSCDDRQGVDQQGVDRQRRSLLMVAAIAPLLSCTTVTSTAARPRPGSIRRRYVDGRFGQIHLYVAQPVHPTRTPLVCFHPTPVSGDFYRDFMLEMASDRIVIAMDTPGYGRSDRPGEPQPMAELAGAAADALDVLGYGRSGLGTVDCLGYHTGCFIAAELAIQRPDLVRRLVLPGIPYYEVNERRELYEELVVPTPFNAGGDELSKAWKFWVTDRNEGVTLQRGAEHAIDQLQASPYSRWAYHAVFSWPAEQRLPLVTQPVLIPNTHGSLKEHSRAAAQLMADVKLIEMPELHHGVFDLGVAQLAAASRAFLDA